MSKSSRAALETKSRVKSLIFTSGGYPPSREAAS